MNAPADVLGLPFREPAFKVGVLSGERLALVEGCCGLALTDSGWLEYDVTPAAVDLDLVKAGRAPLLAEHVRRLDSMLGAAVVAEIADRALRAVVAFGLGAQADRIWALLEMGFPLSISIGNEVQHAVPAGTAPAGRPKFRVIRWKVTEFSVCVRGADESASIRALDVHEDAPAMVARMNERGDAKRLAVRSALHLESWRFWAPGAGARIARTVAGADPDALAAALAAEVASRCDRLETDLAA
jgi:hypothetical protein